MQAAATAISTAGRLLGRLASLPGGLTGPIFAKELRVSSRRRRNFVLRSLYLAGMLLIVVLVWLAATESWTRGYGGNSYAYRASRMARAGETIIFGLVWFQFIAVLLAALIMLSTSISEEVYSRTLGVLMTTPIRSFQIVAGKLCSKLLQLLMLLATSLPLLAIVRVFGGVPWQFIVASLCTTLATALVVAAVTMLFSILFRRAFVTILLSLIVLAVIYGGLPLLVILIVGALKLYRHSALTDSLATMFFAYNPFGSLGMLSVELMEPRATGIVGFYHWWIPCLVCLGMAAAVLLLCVALVRRVALRQAAGDSGTGPVAPVVLMPVGAAPIGPAAGALTEPGAEATGPSREAAPGAAAPPPAAAESRIRPIRGSPILWRELRAGWMRHRVLFWVLVGAAAWLLLIIYALVAAIDHAFSDNDVHAAFLVVYVILGAIITTILAATNVTAEKEANTWEILLCTPLSRAHILLGKAAGVLRKCLPIWGLPMGHVMFFAAIGLMHPVAALYLPIIILSILGLLAGSGLYFGTLFKRTTTAVILNLALAIGLWGGVPLVMALLAEGLPQGEIRNNLRQATEYVLDSNPVFQTALVTSRVAGSSRADRHLVNLTFYWEGANSLGAGETTAYLAMYACIYTGAGALLAFLAGRRIRKARF